MAEAKTLNFSKKSAIEFGLETSKNNIIYFVTIFVVTIVTYGFLGILQLVFAFTHNIILSLLLALLRILVSFVISMGLIKIAITFADKKRAVTRDLFYIKPIFNFFLVFVIKGFIIFIGFTLLIIPGIIWSIKLQYAEYLVVDKDMNAVDALKKSWEMTRGIKWNLFLFGILLFLINAAGFICLFIGLFITVPLSWIANAFVYRKLLSQIS